jgi:hypothetical protein
MNDRRRVLGRHRIGVARMGSVLIRLRQPRVALIVHREMNDRRTNSQATPHWRRSHGLCAHTTVSLSVTGVTATERVVLGSDS